MNAFDLGKKRLSISLLTGEQIDHLERLFSASTPEVWRDFARSFFVSLCSRHGVKNSDFAHLAELAVDLAIGVSIDLGGSQPYIPAGAALKAQHTFQRAIEMRAQGNSYRVVANALGISECRVRQIEKLHCESNSRGLK